MPDVFISYNREDRETARLVANALEAEGFSVWWDAALRAGETYDEVTEANLRQAGAVVVLWSKRSANSKWVRAEATVGERSSTLVPALIEECDRPVRFELVQTADLTRWKGDRNDPNWRAFMQDIEAAISRRAAGKGRQAVAPQATGDAASIETTFWNSVKEGSERSDFEAYLERYPNGHFAALARNRIAAMDRERQRPGAQSATSRPQSAAPARPAQSAPARAPAQSVHQRPAQPKQRATVPPPTAQDGKGGANVLLIGGIAVALLALAGGAMFALNRTPSAPAAAPAATVAAAEAPPAEPQAPPADASAGVVLGPPAEMADLAEAQSPPGGAGELDEVAPDVFAEAPTDDNQPADEPEFADTDLEPVSEAEAPPLPAEPAEPARYVATPAAPGRVKTFRDCDACPLMARIEKGSFVMGSPASEAGRNGYEGPQRTVEISEFAIGVYEVTQAEWKACVDAGACAAKRVDEPLMPVLAVSWREAKSYADWLSKTAKRTYRLPTEAEWEYAARGGTTTAYWWGDKMDRGKVATGSARTVGSLEANGYGLHDVLSNAREWVEDCYANTYADAPTDGSAATSGDCARRVIRGGAWSSNAADMRVANRSRIDQTVRPLYMGVRVAASAKK